MNAYVLALNAKWRAQSVPGGKTQVPPAQKSLDAEQADSPESPRYRINGARLLKRVFKRDIAACPDCGGVQQDQLFYMSRVGFDAFEFRPDKNIEQAVNGLMVFSNSYQAAADNRLPMYRLR